MLNSYIITIKLNNKDYEIFVSPILLHSEHKQQNIKSGMIEVLYFYGQLRDDTYKVMIEQEDLLEKFKTDQYIINYGQDFGKYYLGSLRVDFEAKRYWQWDGKGNKLTEQDVKILGESLFDKEANSKPVILLTPTRPSDFNFAII